jgi:hypothetical protein
VHGRFQMEFAQARLRAVNICGALTLSELLYIIIKSMLSDDDTDDTDDVGDADGDDDDLAGLT